MDHRDACSHRYRTHIGNRGPDPPISTQLNRANSSRSKFLRARTERGSYQDLLKHCKDTSKRFLTGMVLKVVKKDFFISRTRADKGWAEWIAWQLKAAGYSFVVQDWDFRPGQNFALSMHQALQTTERTIAILSPDFLAADYTAPEWAATFAADPRGTEGRLIPVRVRKCKPDGLLKAVIYIDLVGLSEEEAKKRLLEGLKLDRAEPSTQPTFPQQSPIVVPQHPRFPGALPPIWNVPHLRNRNFTGRETLLTDLRATLASGQHAALTQAITGLGGVGKTQLAMEYAYRHTGEYDPTVQTGTDEE